MRASDFLSAGPVPAVTLVLGSSTGGMGRHVRSVAAALSAHGGAVTVVGPRATDEWFGFSRTGAVFEPVEIGTSPRPRADVAAVRRLRRVLGDGTGRGPAAGVVHAHGLRAGLVAGLTVGRCRPGRVPLVVTWHNAVLGHGARRLLLAQLERRVARVADVTLGASGDLVERARSLGAADARLGPVSAPALPAAVVSRAEVRAALGVGERPVVLAVGRLAQQKGFDFLFDAARVWRGEGGPLVLVVGDGPLAGHLRSRVAAEDLPVRLLGHRTDVADLLSACDLVVLPSVWEARALVAQEALRGGRPLVATRVGGVPELVGDAAVLVDYGDVPALRAAVESVVGEVELADRLRRSGPARAAGWPEESDMLGQLLAVYRELTSGGFSHRRTQS